MLVKGDLQQLVLSSDIDRLAGLEGCLSGNVPAAALAGEGGANGPCGQLARAKTVKVVLGPGTFLNEAASQSDEQLATQTKHAAARAKLAEQVVVQRGAEERALAIAKRATSGEQASKITIARFQEVLAKLALEYGLTSQPSIDNRELRLGGRVRLEQAGGHAQAALRLPVPEPRRGARLGAHEGAGSHEAQRNTHDRADPRGGRDAAVAPAARRELRRHRRAGDRLRSDALDHALDRAAADRGAAGDGGDARPDLPRRARGCCRSRSRCSRRRSRSARWRPSARR